MGPIVPAFIIRLQQVPQPEQTAPGSMHNTTNSTAPTAKQQQWPDLVLEPAWHKYSERKCGSIQGQHHNVADDQAVQASHQIEVLALDGGIASATF